MKKNFMLMAAVLMGVMMAFSSCKDSKGAKGAEEDTKQAMTLDKITKASDLDAVDVGSLDLDDLENLDELEWLDDLNVGDLTEKQAGTLLQIMMLAANKELPSNEGDGVTLKGMALDGDDVAFTLEMSKEALQGVPISMFEMIFNSPELKDAMMGEMVNSMTSGDKDMDKFLRVVIAAKKNFCMKFVDAESGESATCRLEGKEMGKLLEDSNKAEKE